MIANLRHYALILATAGALAVGLAAPATATKPAAGEAVTMWFIVFNNPEHCVERPCTDEDLENALVEPSILHADGTVTFDGSVDFVASLYETGDISGLGLNTSLIGGPGLVDAEKAEVHLVVRQHGPTIRGGVIEQVTTFADAGCSELGGPNLCEDTQFAIFMPSENLPENSGVFRFSDLSRVDGARARILRQDGGLQVILRTTLDD